MHKFSLLLNRDYKERMKTLGVDELIVLCKHKDEAAQMEIYHRFHLAMFHTALRIVNTTQR